MLARKLIVVALFGAALGASKSAAKRQAEAFSDPIASLRRNSALAYRLEHTDADGGGLAYELNEPVVLAALPSEAFGRVRPTDEPVVCDGADRRCFVPDRPGQLYPIFTRIASAPDGAERQPHHGMSLVLLAWEHLKLLPPSHYRWVYRRAGADAQPRYGTVPARLLPAGRMPDADALAADADLRADGLTGEKALRLVLYPNAWRFFELGLHVPVRSCFDELGAAGAGRAQAVDAAKASLDKLLKPYAALPWNGPLRAELRRVMDGAAQGDLCAAPAEAGGAGAP